MGFHPVMRHGIVILLGLTLLPCFVQAQNYRQADSYSGPGVVVNMDVIGVNAPPRLAAVANTAVRSENLPPVQLAPRAMPVPVKMVSAPDRSWADPVQENKGDELPLPAPKPPAAPEPAHFSARQMLAIAPKPAPRQLLGSAQDEPVMPVPPSGKMEMVDKPVAAPLKPIEPPQKLASIAPPAPDLSEKIKDTAKGNDDYTIYRVLFDKQSDVLKPSEIRVLDLLVNRLQVDKALTLQMSSFADGTPETAAQARRLSLTRALKLREYLLTKNIAATRLDVRALGTGSKEMENKITHGAADADRVDLVLVR